MAFILRKTLAALLEPFCLGLEFLLFGLLLLWFTRYQRSGKIVVTAGALILLLLGLSPISDSLLRSLEIRYAPMLHGRSEAPLPLLPKRIPWIVVLGGGYHPDERLPVTSALAQESLARLTEAVRLYRLLPGSRLILSGGAVYGAVPESEGLAQTARIMGVPGRDLLQENKSLDTHEQARLIKPIVGNDPFLLVTSASHMTRSLAVFKKQGMTPIPAPAAFRAQAPQESNPTRYYPGASEIQRSEMALHEYLGLLWYRLSGKI